MPGLWPTRYTLAILQPTASASEGAAVGEMTPEVPPKPRYSLTFELPQEPRRSPCTYLMQASRASTFW